jgi:MFS family permease
VSVERISASRSALAAERPHPGASPIAVGLICGLFLAPTALGFSAAPVALPALADALHVNAGATAWTLAAYSLTTAAMTAMCGRIADQHGLRPGVTLAAVALLGGTVVVLVSGQLALVIAGRLIQGVGAGAAGVIAFRLPAERFSDAALRGRAIGTMGLVVGLGSGAGALLGGFLTQAVSWRWALALPGLSVFAIPPIVRALPRHEQLENGRIDPVGAGLCLVVIAAVTVVIEAHSTRIALPFALGAAGITLLAGAALWRHARRTPDGFLPHVLLANARFRLAAAAGFMLFGGYLIMQFAAPLLILAHHHLTTTQIGLILLPAGLASAATSRLAGTLVARVSPWAIVLGLASASTLGLLLAAFAGSGSPVAVVVALAACVAGFSAGQVTLMSALPDIASPEVQGIAVGTFQLVFITGGSVGAAAIGALVSPVGLTGGTAILAAIPAAGLLLALRARRVERGH